MNFFTSLLLATILPVQFWTIGVIFPHDEKSVSSGEKVEGASISNTKKGGGEESFRNSLPKQEKNETALDERGYIPQRKKDFYETKIFSGASVVIDVDSGTILHYDKGRSRMPIASLTKIMTAVVVVENIKNLDETVTIDKEATLADGTKVGCPTSVACPNERLHLDEKISAKDLLTAMLLDSANDAAIALGKHIAGSQKDFAKLMNNKAKDLNLSDSHFCNPTGLDEENCYSSAYDLARITAYSMQYDTIWDIMKMQETSVRSCDGKYEHMLRNTDILLGQIPNCLGGKTGFTYNAGKSLMLSAAHPSLGKHRVIAVILNDNQRWEDMQKLISWTFDNYEWK